MNVLIMSYDHEMNDKLIECLKNRFPTVQTTRYSELPERLSPPDVLIIDYDLEQLGRESLELIGKMHKKFPDIKIIAITALEQLDVVSKPLKQSGVMAVFVKPIEPILVCKFENPVVDLLESIKEHLSN